MDDILPGPYSQSVIQDNQYHVSDDVWQGIERDTLKCYCGNVNMSAWRLRRSQRDLLHICGFGVFANSRVVLHNDAKLMSALVERWRPETNTFFMKRGEMTVTVEDVGYILGLPIFGEAVTCGSIASPTAYFQANWFEPLTTDDVEAALHRGHIKFTWLFERYGEKKCSKTDYREITVATQAYMLYVIGAVLFPTSRGNVVHPRYIQHLRSVRGIKSYAWGPAVLAYLYRGLEHASQKASKSISGCTWLLQVWSYERFPLIGVPARDELEDNDTFPVASWWYYSTKEGVLGKRRSRTPHHNTPLYRNEFDGVAGDHVIWRPYDRFEEVVDWHMIEAQLAGQTRMSLVCCEVVEWQHSDRVMRQFGCGLHIPRAPQQMTPYRASRDSSFLPEDWRVKWFPDIGRWSRFCDSGALFVGLVDDSDAVSEEEYMAWYTHISRPRIGRPQPQLEPQQYPSRELYPNVDGYEVFMAALEMAKSVDAMMPASFEGDWSVIAPRFLTPFLKLMRKIRGPQYQLPPFEHVKLPPDIPASTSVDVRDIPAHDIIDMTQPSQHVSQFEESTSSVATKIPPRRMTDQKWKITKPLSALKKERLANDWGWGFDMQVKLPGIRNELFSLNPLALTSLAPGQWVDDRIIWAYMILLRDREESIHEGTVWERKPSYFFMDPFFMQYALRKWKASRVARRKYGEEAETKVWEGANKLFLDYASGDVGPSIIEVDYIFLPCLVNQNHWILLVFSVKSWHALFLIP